jgi:hypothetical protein
MAQAPGVNAIKLFTMVIYHHFVVIPSFCGITLNDLGNYRGMAVNYYGKKFYTLGPLWKT